MLQYDIKSSTNGCSTQSFGWDSSGGMRGVEYQTFSPVVTAYIAHLGESLFHIKGSGIEPGL